MMQGVVRVCPKSFVLQVFSDSNNTSTTKSNAVFSISTVKFCPYVVAECRLSYVMATSSAAAAVKQFEHPHAGRTIVAARFGCCRANMEATNNTSVLDRVVSAPRSRASGNGASSVGYVVQLKCQVKGRGGRGGRRVS